VKYIVYFSVANRANDETQDDGWLTCSQQSSLSPSRSVIINDNRSVILVVFDSDVAIVFLL
jgi:hypothetical protein